MKKSTKIQCTECDFTTNRIDNLYKHERNVHKLFNKKLDAISKTLEKKGLVKCPKCDKEFSDSKMAEDHLLRQSCDPLKCEECGKEFNKRVDLSTHTRDVHSESKFPCPSCDKRFEQKRNMERHHKKCKLKETNNNEHDEEEIEETVKIKRLHRNKRKQLSKTDNKKHDEQAMIHTKQSRKPIKGKKVNPILSKSIANCLKSLEEDSDYDNDEKDSDNDDLEDEGDFL